MNQVKYEIPNISCGHCVVSVQNAVNTLPGVSGAWADQDTKTVEIDFEAPANEEAIKAVLESINYPVKA